MDGSFYVESHLHIFVARPAKHLSIARNHSHNAKIGAGVLAALQFLRRTTDSSRLDLLFNLFEQGILREWMLKKRISISDCLAQQFGKMGLGVWIVCEVLLDCFL